MLVLSQGGVRGWNSHFRLASVQPRRAHAALLLEDPILQGPLAMLADANIGAENSSFQRAKQKQQHMSRVVWNLRPSLGASHEAQILVPGTRNLRGARNSSVFFLPRFSVVRLRKHLDP